MSVTGAPLSVHVLFICIVYMKPSINASNQSIFRSIIHLDIKLCKKNRKKTKFFFSKNTFNTALGEKYHATAVTFGAIL